jgi:hypothetical protein
MILNVKIGDLLQFYDEESYIYKVIDIKGNKIITEFYSTYFGVNDTHIIRYYELGLYEYATPEVIAADIARRMTA